MYWARRPGPPITHPLVVFTQRKKYNFGHLVDKQGITSWGQTPSGLGRTPFPMFTLQRLQGPQTDVPGMQTGRGSSLKRVTHISGRRDAMLQVF